MELKVVGQPIGRVEGPDKVSGRMVYTADVAVPEALWGKCLRSTMPHARLVRVDASRARQVPGVRAVLTGADVPDFRVGVSLQDLPVLACDKVRFIGDKIAGGGRGDPGSGRGGFGAHRGGIRGVARGGRHRGSPGDGAPVIHEQLAAMPACPPAGGTGPTHYR